MKELKSSIFLVAANLFSKFFLRQSRFSCPEFHGDAKQSAKLSCVYSLPNVNTLIYSSHFLHFFATPFSTLNECNLAIEISRHPKDMKKCSQKLTFISFYISKISFILNTFYSNYRFTYILLCLKLAFSILLISSILSLYLCNLNLVCTFLCF